LFFLLRNKKFEVARQTTTTDKLHFQLAFW
jgi:hypothetical protein